MSPVSKVNRPRLIELVDSLSLLLIVNGKRKRENTTVRTDYKRAETFLFAAGCLDTEHLICLVGCSLRYRNIDRYSRCIVLIISGCYIRRCCNAPITPDKEGPLSFLLYSSRALAAAIWAVHDGRRRIYDGASTTTKRKRKERKGRPSSGGGRVVTVVWQQQSNILLTLTHTSIE